MNAVEHEPAAAIAASLDGVGRRLKRLRTHRKLTLTGVGETTGISKSTLSRLETGGRRPTLELLLALSHVYRVPWTIWWRPLRKAIRAFGSNPAGSRAGR